MTIEELKQNIRATADKDPLLRDADLTITLVDNSDPKAPPLTLIIKANPKGAPHHEKKK